MFERTLPLLLLPVLLGCSLLQSKKDLPQVDVVAVLPIERSPIQRSDGEQGPALPEDAGLAVTAQVYQFLAMRPEFRFVADLTVQEVVQQSSVRNEPDLRSRAVALGKAVSADAVFFGTVSRFRERIGTEWGATSPAAVSFDLGLVQVASGEVLWEGRFDQTQAPLSSNIFDFWMFWRAGPHWFSARELTALGVDELLEEMSKDVRS
jgi:hypothetical protein